MRRLIQGFGIVALTAAAGCSGGGSGGAGPDGGLGGNAGNGGTEGGAGTDGAPADTGLEASSDAGDAQALLDPAKACDLPLKTNGLSCKSEVATSQPVLGGELPEGIYDRTIITSPIPASTCDATSALLLKGGVYQLRFGALGGPFISGGSYTLDAKVGRLIFTTHCGDNDVGYFYEWNAAKETLTLFPDNFTGWVYELRH